MSPVFPVILSTVALRNHSLRDAIDAAAVLGFDQLEIWERHLFETPTDEWTGIKMLLAEKQMAAPVVSPFLSFTRGPERLAASLEAAHRAAAIADQLGSTRFRIFTDVGPDGLSSADATAADWQVATHEIAALCHRYPQFLFAVETHPHTLADTVESIDRLLHEVAASNFKIIFQPISIFMETGLLAVAEKFWSSIAHMHWHQLTAENQSTFIHQPGRVDFPALTRFMREKHYAGTVTAEYCWRDVDLEQIRTDRAFLKELFSAE